MMDKFDFMLEVSKSLEDLNSEEEIDKKKEEMIRAVRIAADLTKANKRDGVSLKTIL